MMTQDECTNLEQLLAILIKYHPEANVDLVSKAYHFAEKAHEGQKRKSGTASSSKTGTERFRFLNNRH